MSYVPVPDYTANTTLRKSKAFRRAADRAIELKEAIDTMTEEFNRLRDEDLTAELVAAGVTEGSVAYNGYQIGRVHRNPGQKLNQKKLIVAMAKRGYDTSVIDEAMDPTPAQDYTTVRSQRVTLNEAQELLAERRRHK